MNIFTSIYGGAPLNAEVPTLNSDRLFNDDMLFDNISEIFVDV